MITPENMQLDSWEQELLESIENDEWQPIPNMEEEISRLQQMAAIHFEGASFFTLKDLQEIKAVLLNNNQVRADLVQKIERAIVLME